MNLKPFYLHVLVPDGFFSSLQLPLNTHQLCPARRLSRAWLRRAAANWAVSWKVPSSPTSRSFASDHLLCIQR